MEKDGENEGIIPLLNTRESKENAAGKGRRNGEREKRLGHYWSKSAMTLGWAFCGMVEQVCHDKGEGKAQSPPVFLANVGKKRYFCHPIHAEKQPVAAQKPSVNMLIILDFDGTLGDTQSLIVHTMQQTIGELGLPARTDEECAARIGLPLKETFADMYPMDDAMGERCAEVYTRFFNKNNVPGAVPLFPHVFDTLRSLHADGHTLTIASSRKSDSLRGYLRDLRLGEFIQYFVSADLIERTKPHPDMVLRTLDDLRMSAEDTLVVGDTSFDILMGCRAGARTVGVTYGNGKREQMEAAGADFIIDDFAQLPDIVGLMNEANAAHRLSASSPSLAGEGVGG